MTLTTFGDDLLMTHFTTYQFPSDDPSDDSDNPLMTSHDLTTLVTTEVMTLIKIDRQKLDIFGKLHILQKCHNFPLLFVKPQETKQTPL